MTDSEGPRPVGCFLCKGGPGPPAAAAACERNEGGLGASAEREAAGVWCQCQFSGEGVFGHPSLARTAYARKLAVPPAAGASKPVDPGLVLFVVLKFNKSQGSNG